MPGNPSIDRLETLECIERNGVIRSLTRVARVFGMGQYLDYRVLWAGLAKAGIPAAYSRLVDTTNNTTIAQTMPFNALVLTERDAKIADLDKGTVDVTLKYEHILDGPNQSLQGFINFLGLSSVLFVRGRSSIVQKPTNFFYYKGQQSVTGTFPITDVFEGIGGTIEITYTGPAVASGSTGTIAGVTGTTEANGTWVLQQGSGGDYILSGTTGQFVHPYLGGGTITFATGTNVPRIQILTGHRFPLTDPDWPGRQFISGGEIQLPYPQENARLAGFAWTSNPLSYKRAIHNKVNATAWMGYPPRTWLCTEAEHEVLDPKGLALPPPTNVAAGTPLYKFEFEFQYDSDTWDQTVTYIDSRTNLPPSNVQPASLADLLNPQVIDQQPDWQPPNEPFPAGYWQVVALPEADYNAFFASKFEGLN